MWFALQIQPDVVVDRREFHIFICAPRVNRGKIACIGSYLLVKITISIFIIPVIWSKKSINGLHFSMFALTLIYQHRAVKLYK